MRFDENGLIPAVVQHARSGEVLMLGYMNAEALQRTQDSGLVTFWSRSRQEYWQKGATSGNVLRVQAIRQDCDADALLVLAEPAGPTCHTGEWSCFHSDLNGERDDAPMPKLAFLSRLGDLVAQRDAERPEGSYTTKLLVGGVDRIGKKIGEEAAEVIIAAKNRNPEELRWELADLLYHSMVLLREQHVSLESVLDELQRRHGGK